MKKLEEIIDEGISCLIPIYETGNGNCTKIISNNGNQFTDRRTLKTVLRSLCQYYTIQVEYCRKKYGKLLQQSICIPILIHNKLLLIPLKMRKPLFEKDGAYGYVNFHEIKSIEDKNGTTIIKLNNGLDVTCIQKIKSVKQYITKAKLVASSGYDLNLLDKPEKAKEFFQQYNAPATKGDIAFLQKEILELGKILKGVAEKEE